MALSATRGKASPFLVFLFLLVPVFQPCFELVFWQLLRNDCSFWFFLQVPINRQATKGKNTLFQSQKSHFVIPLKESQESSRDTHVALSATRGKASPFLVFLFLLVPVFQPCFELVFWQLLRNDCSFWFFLQVPINRQATEGKNTPFQSQKSHFVIPLKESQESSREERKIGSEN